MAISPGDSFTLTDCEGAMRRLIPAAMLAVVTVPFGLRADDVPKKPSDPTPEAQLVQKRIVDLTAENPQVIPNLTHLCYQIGPRLTGSAALKRANEWTAEVMKSYGLENVRLEPWEIPVGWQRGTATARMVQPGNGRQLAVASGGWSGSTNGKVIGEVVVMDARTTADLAKFKGKLKNAIVLRGAPSMVRPIGEAPQAPGAAPPGGRRGGGGGGQPPAGAQPFERMRAFQNELREFLRAEGVAAFMSDSGKPHGLLVTTGGWPRNADRVNSGEPLPTLYVGHEDYLMLYRLATLKGGPTPKIELEVTNKFVPGPITVYNTVGEIRGSEKPDEFVVLGAHLDSWDLAQGATDNGTGSCVVLEVARVLAKCGVKPKRTIRFVLFSGEEQGLHGSREYVKRHEAEMPKTSLALVHDTGTGKVIGIGTQGRASIKAMLEGALGETLKGLGCADISLRGMGGTDHLSFEQKGVPGFACIQDPDEYRLTHHTQTDTLDKAKEPNLIQGAQVMALLAMHVANLPELLPRDRPAGAGGRGQTPPAPPPAAKPPETAKPPQP
jgi:carboxypeptidase Q